MTQTALIIDDDRSERRITSRLLKTHLYLSCLQAENGKEGIEILEHNPDIKLIVMDLDMPVMDGRDALKHCLEKHQGIPIIVLTGSRNMDDAIAMMKLGAFDFLSKPIDQDRLILSAHNALKMSLMSKEISRLKKQEQQEFKFADLIGCNDGLSSSIKIGLKAAKHNLPVLVNGETGKEMFAHAIHGESNRANNKFIAVNCGALPEKLIESTLFGYEKGAFTGAVDKSLGKFQEANGGTLFLDEIGELPLEAQVKLLRALQQKEVEPVGAGQSVRVDVRIISATNKNLETEVKEGRFREDLYFRLNVLQILIPPLRDRKGDIPDLTHHFIDMFCSTHQIMRPQFSNDATQRLMGHSWPGNVRELENTINRTIALSDNVILSQNDIILGSDVNTPLPKALENTIHTVNEDGSYKCYKDLEQEIINDALRHHDQNMAKTARVLGLAKSTLYAKVPHINEYKKDATL